MIYGIADKPSFTKTILFAIQMVLAVFVASVLIAQICGVSASGALVGAGCATLVYILCTKSKSPMFISNSGNFVAPVMMAIAVGGYTAVAIGGLTTCIVYCVLGLIFTKVSVDNIYKVFPKSLIGAVTMVIGITLMGFISTYLQINGVVNMWGVSVTLVTMVAIALISHYAKGMFKILPFIVGIMVGYIYATILTISGVFTIIDFSVFNNLTLFSIPDFAFTHWESVGWDVVAPVVITFVCYTISGCMECLADHAALGNIIGTDLFRTAGLNRIFIGEGFANLIGTCVGGLSTCSYGEGVATVGFSKVASIRVTITAAIILALLGCLAPIQAFIASIPSCCFAGAAVILYGFIACSGVKMLQNVDLNIQKNLIIVSAVLSIGLGGMVIGGATLSFSGTALALIIGVVLNFILKEE